MKLGKKSGKALSCLMAAVILLLCSSCKKEPVSADAQQIVNLLSGSGQEYNGGIIITAQTGCLGYNENSLLGAKAGLKTQASAIEVDISFLEDGTPVLAKSFYEADENSVPLKVLFEEMKRFPDAKIYLYLREISNIQGIDELVIEYNMINRVFLIGVTESTIEFLLSCGSNLPYYLNFETDEKTAGDETAVAKELEGVAEYCPMGIVVPAAKLTKELVESALNNYGFEVLAIDAQSSQEIANAFKCGATNIITKSPDVAIESLRLLVKSTAEEVTA